MMKTYAASACTRFLPRRKMLVSGLAIIASGLLSQSAFAFEIDTGNPEVKLRWDNTLKYSTSYRLKDQDPALLTSSNGDDGDRNFEAGFVSNRVDLLSEMDLQYHDFGVRVSGAAWYDTIYNNDTTDNTSPGTSNNYGPAANFNKFPDATRELHGGKYELLDAFAFGKGRIGDMPVSGRVGRFALIWGESLFFGSNGIAAGMAPIDIVKLTSVPNSQAKEVTRPVGQASGQIQITDDLTFGAYYQYDWEPSRLNGVGSFLSTSDVLGAGAENFLFGPFPGALVAVDKARDSGQYGFQLRYAFDQATVGVYMINYHDKTPKLIIDPVPPVRRYKLVFPEDIKAYGASVSTNILDVAVAGEFSVRTNAPLVDDAVTDPALASNNDNVTWGVGRTAHANLNAFYTVPRNFISDGGALLAEVAWNEVMKVTKNRADVEPFASKDAVAFRMVFTNNFYQVLPNVDVFIPIGFSYSPAGRSGAVSNFAVDHGGDVSIGINAEFQQVWKAGLSFTHYYGDPGPAVTAAGRFTFEQSLRDRDFIAFNISRTF